MWTFCSCSELHQKTTSPTSHKRSEAEAEELWSLRSLDACPAGTDQPGGAGKRRPLVSTSHSVTIHYTQINCATWLKRFNTSILHGPNERPIILHNYFITRWHPISPWTQRSIPPKADAVLRANRRKWCKLSHSLPYFIFVFVVPILKGATFLKIWPVHVSCLYTRKGDQKKSWKLKILF